MQATPTPTSTFGLVERFKSGDEEAFAQLFEKYRRRLAVLIHYKLSPGWQGTMEVDDVLQETFFAAAQDAGSFAYRAPGSFLSWLARIAEHIIIDEARARARQKRLAKEVVRFRSESNPAGPEPADSNTPIADGHAAVPWRDVRRASSKHLRAGPGAAATAEPGGAGRPAKHLHEGHGEEAGGALCDCAGNG
ncbi:MAG: ECF-type sigma factor [Acidobacteria bacterium]|nr:ECF-type sigma factor [Acidobacteriota bacterium]MCL5288158.1 ECF-type sigma factor [Acidobacteriota bacterium]